MPNAFTLQPTTKSANIAEYKAYLLKGFYVGVKQ